MTGLIWYRHDGLDTVTWQPRDALAQLAQGGWYPLPEEDVAALEQAAADAVAADERAMQAQVAEAVAARDARDQAALAEAEETLASPDDVEVPTVTTEPPAEATTEEND